MKRGMNASPAWPDVGGGDLVTFDSGGLVVTTEVGDGLGGGGGLALRVGLAGSWRRVGLGGGLVTSVGCLAIDSAGVDGLADDDLGDGLGLTLVGPDSPGNTLGVGAAGCPDISCCCLAITRWRILLMASAGS